MIFCSRRECRLPMSPFVPLQSHWWFSLWKALFGATTESQTSYYDFKEYDINQSLEPYIPALLPPQPPTQPSCNNSMNRTYSFFSPFLFLTFWCPQGLDMALYPQCQQHFLHPTIITGRVWNSRGSTYSFPQRRLWALWRQGPYLSRFGIMSTQMGSDIWYSMKVYCVKLLLLLWYSVFISRREGGFPQ